MELIENGSDLADATADLKKGDSYYVDTEFESSRNGTRLSLIQVSRGEEIYLVDALKIRDLTPLGAALGRPEVTWITHAGLQDVDLLVPALDIAEPPALFDTQVAWALQGPEPSVSLSYLKFQLLGLRTMKTHQADDWIRRPLPESQLQYAAEDVEHLPEIEKLLKERLAKLDREALVPTICREQLWPKGEPVRPISLDSFRNAWQLGEKPGRAAIPGSLVQRPARERTAARPLCQKPPGHCEPYAAERGRSLSTQRHPPRLGRRQCRYTDSSDERSRRQRAFGRL